MPLINRFDELHSFKKELDYDLANSNEDWFSVFPYDSDIRIKYANEFEGILYDYFSDCEELKESAKKDDIFLAFVFWSMLVAQHEYGNVPNALELFENEYKFDMVDRASRFSDYIMQSRATESFNDRIVSGEYGGGTLERARNIARNETNRLVNGMTHEAMKGLYQKHMWVSENDKRTRKTHRKADGQIVDIDKPFKVGGYEMMFPGDDSLGAPLKEIINCRCMEMFSNDLLSESEKQYNDDNGNLLITDSYDFERMQNYRDVSTTSDNVDIQRGSVNIRLYRMKEYENIFSSLNAKLKPRQMHIFNKNYNKAVSVCGLSKANSMPPIYIVSSMEMQLNAIASYNPVKNILFINESYINTKDGTSLQKDFTNSDNPISTLVHELIHFKDAEAYRKKFGNIDDFAKYIDYINKKSQKHLENIAKTGYSIKKVSKYAELSFEKRDYAEAYTEYRTNKLLGGD